MEKMIYLAIGILIGINLLGWLRAWAEYRRNRPFRKERRYRGERARMRALLLAATLKTRA